MNNTFNFKTAISETVFSPISGAFFTIPHFVQLLIRLLFVASAIGFFVYLLIGAVQWIFSGGDKEAVSKAQRRITHALIGIAIVFSIYVIVNLINFIFKVNILSIDVPKLGPPPAAP